MRKLALVSVLILGGCASSYQFTPTQKLMLTCDSYAASLKVLATARSKLSESDIQAVDAVRALVNPICLADTPPTTGEALYTVERGLSELLILRAGVQ